MLYTLHILWLIHLFVYSISFLSSNVISISLGWNCCYSDEKCAIYSWFTDQTILYAHILYTLERYISLPPPCMMDANEKLPVINDHFENC